MESQFIQDALMALVILWGAAALGTITYLIWKKVAGRG